MNQQEIFDKVATHLIAQGKQSLGYGDIDGHLAQACAYRGRGGTMCAAGCLIPDDEYKPEFEGISWDGLAQDVPSFANAPLEVHNLIGSLQCVHDDVLSWSSTESLKKALFGLANYYGLSADVLN